MSKFSDALKSSIAIHNRAHKYKWLRVVQSFKLRYICTLFLGISAIIPSMALVLLVTYAFSQLQGEPRQLTWQELLGEHASRWLSPFVRNSSVEHGLTVEYQRWYFPILLLLTGCLANFLKGFQEYLLEDMGERYCRDLRSAVAENYLNSSYSQAKESNASLLAQFLGDDAREIRQSFTRICGSIPTEIANSFFYFCFLALLDTQLFVLFFSIFLPIGLIIRLTGNHLRKLAKTGIRIQTELSQSFLEKVRGWQSIQSFSSRPTELKRFNSTNSTILNIWRRSARAKAMSSPTVEWLGIAAGACVLILALRRVHEGALANTILTAFLVTVVQLSNSLQTTVNQLNGAKKGSAALNRMFEFLDQIGSQQNRQTKESRRKTENMLSLKRTLRANDVAIRRQGSEGEYLFRDLKFEFNFGENILVKGPSGRGKSTLLESICGLKPPDKGHFSIELENGRIIENPRLSDFAEVAYLTQEPFIFAGTVGENVCYPHKWDSKCMTDLTRVRTALEKACLSNLSVDASVLTLSGGERQRLAFARGFFSEPDVWLIDEGTSALDAQTEQQLLHQLKSKSEKSIKIFVAHRPMTQKFVDKVITLDQL